MTAHDSTENDEARELRESAERLQHNEGVLIVPGAGRSLGGEPSDDAVAPDDYSADPRSSSHVGPGTVDDVPLDYGQELFDPADQHLIPNHAPLRRGECREDEIAREDAGLADQDELWDVQRALVEEDEASGLRLAGVSDDEVGPVLDAMGDEVADSLPDAPGGKSATGSDTP